MTEFKEHWYGPASMVNIFTTLMILVNCYKEDKVLSDTEMNRFTLNPEYQVKYTDEEGGLPEGLDTRDTFELNSDRVKRLYPTYV